MRISHKHKFIFISKPKCASTSVRKLLDPFSDIFSSDIHPFHHHVTAFELKCHFDSSGWHWDEYFKFITVRNPWDMIVSWFHYSKPDINGNYWYMNDYKPDKLILFEDWVLNKKKTFHNPIPSLNRLGYFSNDFSAITLDKYIKDEDNNVIVDKVIKVQDLNVEIPIIIDRLNLPLKWENIRINTTNHEEYSTYYNDKTRDIIKEQFLADINYSGYEF